MVNVIMEFLLLYFTSCNLDKATIKKKFVSCPAGGRNYGANPFSPLFSSFFGKKKKKFLFFWGGGIEN